MANRRKKSSGPKSSIKINGRVYKKKSCSRTKGAANKAAKAARASGKVATVRKSGSTYCVYVGGKRKRA